MASENEGVRDTLANSGRLLEPLPSLTSTPNLKEEKLDAGLRSLDHCELSRSYKLLSIGLMRG